MKKVKGLLITTILAVCAAIACFAFAACSSGLEGTYKFSSMTVTEGETTTTIESGESYMGITLDEDYIVLELKKGGDFSMKAMGQTQKGTWKEEKDVIKLTANGSTIEAKHSGKTLTLEITTGVNVKLSK